MTPDQFKFINEKEVKEFFKKKGFDSDIDMLNGFSEVLEEAIMRKLKQKRNKKRIQDNDSKKDTVPALSILTKDQIASLPGWVKAELEDAVVVGSSKQVIKTPDGKKFHIANPLNDLSGAQWTYYLNSVITTRYPTTGPEAFAHHIRKIHPSPKPPQLMQSIIEFFTKENDLILDYFMGVGGTLIGASLANRRAIGIDLNQLYIDTYKEANAYLELKEQKTIQANSIQLLANEKEMQKVLQGEKLSLIAIDPPYGNMMSKRKTGEALKRGKDTSPTPFTESSDDLGNLTLDHFYQVFKVSVEHAIRYLKEKGHVIVFIKDLQPEKQKTNLLHAKVIEDLNEIAGLQYLGTKIWADNSVNLYPYGYPYAYVSNQIHQYIMTFRKQS